MNDAAILDLYWTRSESAITETAKQYGVYCMAIAMNILRNMEDAEECVNDTYLNAWNVIPP
jgi:RNA polymerase sigma-70 factor (ECF subfamily)